MTRTAICTVEPVISEGGLGMSEVYILSNSLTLREYTYIISIVLFDNTDSNNLRGVTMDELVENYFCDSLGEYLDITVTYVEHEPENGVFYEAEWVAIDENGKDRKDDMKIKEVDECSALIYKYLTKL